MERQAGRFECRGGGFDVEATGRNFLRLLKLVDATTQKLQRSVGSLVRKILTTKGEIIRIAGDPWRFRRNFETNHGVLESKGATKFRG